MIHILSERLLLQRKRTGLSLQEVKRRTKIAVSTISSYERGSTVPTAPQLLKLAKCYGVSTDYLLGLKKPSQNVIKTDGLDDQEVALVEELIQVLLRAKGQPHRLKLLSFSQNLHLHGDDPSDDDDDMIDAVETNG